ncbi:MAG: N-acetylglutamate synthase-like GNAT family acetyltransferase [Flavobacteriales bacterium]|jgi:N-acetylglutamate synthase-like GNAT family acetyltransferase
MIRIIDYKPELGHYFEGINKEWIAKYFVLEPIDNKVLEQHKEYILAKGGFIFFAENDKKEIVGTVALKKESEGIFELSKMGVIPEFQGKGIGKMLVQFCLNFAKKHQFKTVFLDSSRKLENALHIYSKMGFVEVPVPTSEYERCDIRMEIKLS